MNIYESITKIMAEGYAITKDKRCQQGASFAYRGVDDVMNTFQPLLAKHRVFLVPEVLEQVREERKTAKGNNLIYSILRIRYTFYADDGTSVSAVVTGEAMDSGDKASNKAMSIAFKYAMFQTFCIPTEEMQDPDAACPPPSEKVEHCSACGAEVKGYTNKKGKQITASNHIAWSNKHFGKTLCLECSQKAYASKQEDLAAGEPDGN